MSSKLVSLRKAAYQRQKGCCYYCGCKMDFVPKGRCSGLACTAEHLVARSDGGKDTLGNIVAACQFCNRTRHKAGRLKSAEAYRQYVQRRVASGRWNVPLR